MLLKKKKIPKYIIDNIKISSDSDRENSDKENSDKENSLMKKTLMKKILVKKIKKYFHNFFSIY